MAVTGRGPHCRRGGRRRRQLLAGRRCHQHTVGQGPDSGGVNGEGAGGVRRQVVEQGVGGGCKASKVAEAGAGNGTVQCELGEEGGWEGAGGKAVRKGKSVDAGTVIWGNAVGGVGGIAGEGEGAVRPRRLGGGRGGRG